MLLSVCFPLRLFASPPVLFLYDWGPQVHVAVVSDALFPFAMVHFLGPVSLALLLQPGFTSAVSLCVLILYFVSTFLACSCVVTPDVLCRCLLQMRYGRALASSYCR